MARSRRAGWIAGVALLAAAGAWLVWRAAPPRAATDGAAAPAAVSAAPPTVGAIGRLEPEGDVVTVAGPSDLVVVVGELLVDEGERVEEGQTLARLDDFGVRRAEVERTSAELSNALRELRRNQELHAGKVIAESLRDSWQLRADVARANLHRAQARLALAEVRSPIKGRVIEIHTRSGERVAEEGIADLAATESMFAVAEVFETDIRRVQVGQRARVTSSALPHPLYGTVERIGMKVGKADALGTDPAARTDARVVEADIRLDESAPAEGLTYLQVEIEIGVDDGS
jgi:HlyD family secretion protein